MTKEQLLHYLRGECTEAEAAAVDRWLLEDPQHADTLAELLSDVTPVAVNKDAITARVLASVDTTSEKNRENRTVRMYTFLRVAASIALLLAAGVYLYRVAFQADTDVTYRHIAVGLAVKSDAWLEDSSRVVINKQSDLQVPTHFTAQARTVKLSGEAFFAVHRDEARPFTIYTDHATVEVLGTSFNVRSYDADESVVVTVASGVVRVRTTGGEIVLTKGEQAIVQKKTGHITHLTVDDEEYTAWTHGRIYYHNQPLAHILKGLEATYGLRFDADSTVNLAQRITLNQKISGVPATLEILSVLAGVHCRQAGDSLVYMTAKPHNDL